MTIVLFSPWLLVRLFLCLFLWWIHLHCFLFVGRHFSDSNNDWMSFVLSPVLQFTMKATVALSHEWLTQWHDSDSFSCQCECDFVLVSLSVSVNWMTDPTDRVWLWVWVTVCERDTDSECDSDCECDWLTRDCPVGPSAADCNCKCDQSGAVN